MTICPDDGRERAPRASTAAQPLGLNEQSSNCAQAHDAALVDAECFNLE
jgi:hypothetical protein